MRNKIISSTIVEKSPNEIVCQRKDCNSPVDVVNIIQIGAAVGHELGAWICIYVLVLALDQTLFCVSTLLTMDYHYILGN